MFNISKEELVALTMSFGGINNEKVLWDSNKDHIERNGGMMKAFAESLKLDPKEYVVFGGEYGRAMNSIIGEHHTIEQSLNECELDRDDITIGDRE